MNPNPRNVNKEVISELCLCEVALL
jgi:hypothetical protein